MGKEWQRLDIRDLFLGEVDVFQEVKCLFESSRNKVVAMRRKIADKQFEGGTSGKIGLHVRCPHRQFIEVSQEPRVGWESRVGPRRHGRVLAARMPP